MFYKFNSLLWSLARKTRSTRFFFKEDVMKRAISVLLLATTLSLAAVASLYAETIYVGDRLVVGIRATPEAAAPSIGNLTSDDPVELLEEGDVFFLVRTEDGTEGYIKKQYLTRSRPKNLIIADLEKKLAREKKALADLKASMSSSESDLEKNQAKLNATIEQLQQQLAEQEKELTERAKGAENLKQDLAEARKKFNNLKKDSEDVISIVNERERLKQENAGLTDELNSLREENAYLLRSGVIKWFLAGAGVLFIGWMIGKSSRRKRRY
ncbi:MAG: TIGR04211 family SH3 domain-containing protein [Desulfuromonas sp.]|nr:MAG: TIGR04211 family SH3 domain-containing protein [Desulfuromonas sp.]